MQVCNYFATKKDALVSVLLLYLCYLCYWSSHGFSVTGLARVRGQLGDTHLVRLRNPWGRWKNLQHHHLQHHLRDHGHLKVIALKDMQMRSILKMVKSSVSEHFYCSCKYLQLRIRTRTMIRNRYCDGGRPDIPL